LIPNTLNKFVKRDKDKIDPKSHNEVVYKIDCLNCSSSYVGQTKRQFRTRLKEHMSDINKKNDVLSVVSNHRLEYNHDMNWDEATILDMESSYIKRLVSEMVYIKRQANEQAEWYGLAAGGVSQSLKSFLRLSKYDWLVSPLFSSVVLLVDSDCFAFHFNCQLHVKQSITYIYS